MASNPTATTYTPDGQPIVVNVQIAAPADSTASSGIIEPKVAHVGQEQAPLNTSNATAPSETTASLANLTTGLAGMVLTAPAAVLEKVAPTIAGHVSTAASAAGQHLSNASDTLANATGSLVHGTKTVASNAAGTTQDLASSATNAASNATSSVQGTVTDAAQTASANVNAAAQVAGDKTAATYNAIPGSTTEAKELSQSYLASAASYLPTAVQSLLPGSITGGHPSTLGTNESPLAPCTTPVVDKASELSTGAQNKASDLASGAQDRVQDAAAGAQDKVHAVAARAEQATAPTSGTSSDLLGGSTTHRVPSSGIESGVTDIGRDAPSTHSSVGGTALQNTPAPYNTSTGSAAQIDLERHRDSASTRAPGYDSTDIDSKIAQAKSALSNSAFAPSSDSYLTDARQNYDPSKSVTNQSGLAATGYAVTDAARQDESTRLAAQLKPDSQKTYPEIAKDTVVGKTDDLARYAQQQIKY